jgi:hypothetical protein
VSPKVVEGIRSPRYVAVVTRSLDPPIGGTLPMAIHLTPTELARESGLERRDVIAKCMELGVPIFQGRIDKTLFLATLQSNVPVGSSPAEATA